MDTLGPQTHHRSAYKIGTSKRELPKVGRQALQILVLPIALQALACGTPADYEQSLHADSSPVARSNELPILPKSVLMSSVRVMELAPAQTDLIVNVKKTVEPQQENRVHVTMKSGRLLLNTKVKGWPQISRFELEFNDVNIPAWRFPPSGLRLRNLSASLLEADISNAEDLDDGQAKFSGLGTLSLNWSMLDEQDELIKLRPAILRDLEFNGLLSMDSTSGSSLELRASGEGTLWNWVNVLELKDLTFSSQAYESQPEE